MIARSSVETWRTLAVAIVGVGAAGTGLELLLLGHNEEFQQWIPLVFLALGCLVAAWAGWTRSRAAVRTLRAVMALYLPVAAVGVFFHLRSNLEFERELNPAISGWELVSQTLTGAMPALAPGAMAYIGLLGLLACFRHPALQQDG